MKKYILIALAALVIGAALSYWFGSGPQQPAPFSGAINKAAPPTVQSAGAPPSGAAPAPGTSPAMVKPDHTAEVERQNKMWDLLLATPITFYGKVVDTDGVPVSDAAVSISAVDHAYDEHSKFQKTTDSGGMFSISTHGLALVVNVSKDGCYRTKESGGTYGYSSAGGPVNPHPNPSDPAIFVLRKMGHAEWLIVNHRNVKIARDGTAKQMDLTTGFTNNITNVDFVVQAWTQDQGRSANSNLPYDWRCKLTVPGGGLLERSGGQFDFTAPESGYKESADIDMPTSAKPWSQNTSRSYFLKLARGNYARIDFQMVAGGDHFFVTTSYLNPTVGHRNLEYDPSIKAPNRER